MAQGRAKELKMAMFVTDPSFKIGGSRAFLMHEDLVYMSDQFGDHTIQATLDKPFETDFASIPLIVPKWLLNPLGGGILDRHGRSRLPAVLHDYFCRAAITYEERVEAHQMFLEAMESELVGKVTRRIMYTAVRLNTERLRIMRKWK
jgi:hypothetical protein